MARKTQESPQLDMTPMIDVVFELIIFFVVTLKMTQEKDDTIRLEDGKHGIVLTPDELPPGHMIVDIARNGRISMNNGTLTPEQVGQRVKDRYRRYGEFPMLIRADYRTKHENVARVMNACTANGIWKIAFVAVQDRKSGRPKGE